MYAIVVSLEITVIKLLKVNFSTIFFLTYKYLMYFLGAAL